MATTYCRERAIQIINPSGLKFARKISPTDLDAVIGFSPEKVLIVIEAKTKGTEITMGQKLLMDQLCRLSKKANEHFLGIVCQHDTHYSEDIFLEKCLVISYKTSNLDC